MKMLGFVFALVTAAGASCALSMVCPLHNMVSSSERTFYQNGHQWATYRHGSHSFTVQCD